MKSIDYLEFIFDEDIICGQNSKDIYFSCEIPIEFFPESFKKMYYEDKEYALKIGAPTERSRNPKDIGIFKTLIFKALMNEAGL